MSENVPLVPGVPACNGSAAPEEGLLLADGIANGITRAVGMVPCMETAAQPGAPLAKGNVEESGNSLAEDIAHGDCDGEEQCREKQEENVVALHQGAAEPQGTTEPQDMGACKLELEEGQRALGAACSPGGEAAVTPTGSTEQRGNEAEEEEEEEEEEDTEEDEVQVIEMPKGSSAVTPQQEGGTEPSPPGSPACSAPAERAGEQLGLGKKNDISRHSYSRYNTISYRKIRKGNTKQRIDEFESMMHL